MLAPQQLPANGPILLAVMANVKLEAEVKVVPSSDQLCVQVFHVRWIRIHSGDIVPARLVVDATGRALLSSATLYLVVGCPLIKVAAKIRV